jgi:hypothetical protein
MDPLPAPTLYDDWRVRRERLLAEAVQAGDGYHEVLIKLLDYLLKRYQNDAAALRPARFPLPSEVVWKQRTMVVHRHLRSKDQAPIRESGEAQTRASRILSRIAAQAPQESVGIPGGGALGTGDFQSLLKASVESIPWTLGRFTVSVDRTQFLCANFTRLARPDQDMLMRRWFERLLPTDDRAPDFEMARDAWIGLTCSGREDYLEYVFQLWREYLLAPRCDYWLSETEDVLRIPFNRERVADLLRSELANDRPPIRLRALTLLRELGSLDDVGLLSDLLALPKQEDEAPEERETMLETLKALTGP